MILALITNAYEKEKSAAASLSRQREAVFLNQSISGTV